MGRRRGGRVRRRLSRKARREKTGMEEHYLSPAPAVEGPPVRPRGVVVSATAGGVCLSGSAAVERPNADAVRSRCGSPPRADAQPRLDPRAERLQWLRNADAKWRGTCAGGRPGRNWCGEPPPAPALALPDFSDLPNRTHDLRPTLSWSPEDVTPRVQAKVFRATPLRRVSSWLR